MPLTETVAQVGEYAVGSVMAGGLTALTTAVGYLWRRIEKELDECKQDRRKLWDEIADLKSHRNDT